MHLPTDFINVYVVFWPTRFVFLVLLACFFGGVWRKMCCILCARLKIRLFRSRRCFHCCCLQFKWIIISGRGNFQPWPQPLFKPPNMLSAIICITFLWSVPDWRLRHEFKAKPPNLVQTMEHCPITVSACWACICAPRGHCLYVFEYGSECVCADLAFCFGLLFLKCT